MGDTMLEFGFIAGESVEVLLPLECTSIEIEYNIYTLEDVPSLELF